MGLRAFMCLRLTQVSPHKRFATSELRGTLGFVKRVVRAIDERSGVLMVVVYGPAGARSCSDFRTQCAPRGGDAVSCEQRGRVQVARGDERSDHDKLIGSASHEQI